MLFTPLVVQWLAAGFAHHHIHQRLNINPPSGAPDPSELLATRQRLDTYPPSSTWGPSEQMESERPTSLSHPSFFCWSVVVPGSYEVGLIGQQFSMRAGIFACDFHKVFTDKPLHVQSLQTVHIQTTAIAGQTPDGTAANTKVFLDAWNVIGHQGWHEICDWTVKADPDAVLLPGRLRSKLVPGEEPASPWPPPYDTDPDVAGQFVTNCDLMTKWDRGWGDGWPAMWGSVEVISRRALEVYFERQTECMDQFDWEHVGEDVYMARCLRIFHSGELFIRAGDCHCAGIRYGSCDDRSYFVFHKYKELDGWRECWNQANGNE